MDYFIELPRVISNKTSFVWIERCLIIIHITVFIWHQRKTSTTTVDQLPKPATGPSDITVRHLIFYVKG